MTKGAGTAPRTGLWLALLAAFGSWWLGERISIAQIAGAALVIAGVIVVSLNMPLGRARRCA